mmetsp:Transcript_38984/g.90261  ORF Transcript_38984/g.90261 Transcript_38984/m.90261 type:complete len:220 (+) Transcript_38984:1598-2257(+)
MRDLMLLPMQIGIIGSPRSAAPLTRRAWQCNCCGGSGENGTTRGLVGCAAFTRLDHGFFTGPATIKLCRLHSCAEPLANTATGGALAPILPQAKGTVHWAWVGVAELPLCAVAGTWDAAVVFLVLPVPRLRADATVAGHRASTPISPLVPLTLHCTFHHVAVSFLLSLSSTGLTTILPRDSNVTEALDLATTAQFRARRPRGPFIPLAIPRTALRVAEV